MKYLNRIIIVLAVTALPLAANADSIPNPLGDDVDSLEKLIIRISTGLLGLIAVGATFMFIYGGIMMLTSSGNEKRVTQAKEILRWTTLGLVFIFLAGVILRFVYQTFGVPIDNDISGSLSIGQGNVSETAVRVLNTVIGLLGIIAVTMIVWSGYRWLTAAGNERRIEQAKQILTAAVVGLIIIVLSWAIVRYVILTSANVTNAP